MDLISTEFTHQKQVVLQPLILGHLQAPSLYSPLFKMDYRLPNPGTSKKSMENEGRPGNP